MKKSEESSSTEELNTENGKSIIPSNLSARKWKKKKKVDDIEEPIKVNIEKAKHIEIVQVHEKNGKVFNRKQIVGSDKTEPIKANKTAKQKSATEKKTREPQWFDKYTHLQLSKLPIGIKEEDVEVDMSGDTDTHWVMNWKDPKSGKMVQAYTKRFLQNNALVKWERIEKIKQSDIDLIKGKSVSLLKQADLSQSTKDALAVIAIISHTGLRPGDEKGFKFSGNRGVSTLHSDNLKIVKDKIFFNFTGKSYKENNAFIQNKTLADYLKQRQESNKDKAFMFETNKKQIDFVFKSKLGMKGFKIKDLRTYIATDMARQILLDDKLAPPPMPSNKAEIKKLIDKKLKEVFEKVSQQLNNSPAMAKSSYVHPSIIDAWLVKLGIDEKLLKAESEVHILSDFTLDNIIAWNKSRNIMKQKTKEINDFDDEQCIEYPQPSWME